MLFHLKVGHFTMDSTSNNSSMLKHLKTLLKNCSISTHFDLIDNWVYCYAHTIDLSCKAVVGLIPDDAKEAQDDKPLSCHPVALTCMVVQCIQGLNLCQDGLREVIDDSNKKGWFKHDGKTIQVRQVQLLCYMHTQWDLCYHMLSQLRELCPVSAILDSWDSSLSKTKLPLGRQLTTSSHSHNLKTLPSTRFQLMNGNA
jgi:hypothetical protein